jgi:spore germination cell wall hydrolase CwlJ-like protein
MKLKAGILSQYHMRLFDSNNLAIAVIWQEARGEPREGKMAVGEVIRNRMRLRYSSDGTVVGTVMRPYQFSGMNTDDKNRIGAFNLDDDDPLVLDCAQAWAESQWSDYSNGATLYHAAGMDIFPWWVPNCRKVAEVGGHIFYVEHK